MREKFFGILLTGLEHHTPGPVLCIQTQILLNATARAFGRKGIRVWNHSPQRALREYAAFSVQCMNASPAEPERIFREAFRTGAAIRRITGFLKPEDIQRLVFFLYRNIRIRMQGNIPGELKIPACYFSRIYTPEQCALMSCMDSGIISGLCGGGRLTFTERITEGCSACRAVFCADGDTFS